MSFLRALGRRARRVLGFGSRTHYRNPRRFWDRRFARHGTSLAGPGRLGLADEHNAQDYAEKWRRIEGLLQRYSPTAQEQSVLDAGCGIGWFTEHLVALGYRVDALDFSRTAIRTARTRLGDKVRWHVAPLHDFHPHQRYDMVVCIDVLFHVVDDALWRRSVRNLADLVAPHGTLVIEEEFKVEEPPAGSSGRRHFRWRTLADYRRVLPEWEVCDNERYWLPGSGGAKDLVALQVDDT